MSNTEITTKAKEYKELTQFIKQLEDEAAALKSAIVAEMEARETDTVHTDLFTIKYTEYTSSRIDTTSLKKVMPEVAAQFTKTSAARRFSVA